MAEQVIDESREFARWNLQNGGETQPVVTGGEVAYVCMIDLGTPEPSAEADGFEMVVLAAHGLRRSVA